MTDAQTTPRSPIAASGGAPRSAQKDAIRGLILSARAEGEATRYCVSLLSGDIGAETLVHQTEDQREAALIWKRCAEELRLPLYIAQGENDYVLVEDRLGALAVRTRKARKRGSPLSARRSRISLRRDTVNPWKPLETFEEYEIIARS
jgi:hypothetical protein